MLWTVVLILVLVWLFGGGVSMEHGPALGSNSLIHLILVIVVIVIVIQVLSGRAPRDP